MFSPISRSNLKILTINICRRWPNRSLKIYIYLGKNIWKKCILEKKSVDLVEFNFSLWRRSQWAHVGNRDYSFCYTINNKYFGAVSTFNFFGRAILNDFQSWKQILPNLKFEFQDYACIKLFPSVMPFIIRIFSQIL